MAARIKHLSRLKGQRFSRVMLRPVVPELRGANVSIVHEHLPKGSELPAVMHRKTTELVFCLSGTLTAVLGKKRHVLRPGSIVWIPPGTWHRFISGKNDVECLSVFTPPLRLNREADVCVR